MLYLKHMRHHDYTVVCRSFCLPETPHACTRPPWLRTVSLDCHAKALQCVLYGIQLNVGGRQRHQSSTAQMLTLSTQQSLLV